MRNRILVCLLALALVFSMGSCVFLVEELHEHQYGAEWVADDTYHWHVCTGEECETIGDMAQHKGGTATDTERAKCEVCGAEYGKTLSHSHSFGEWETKTPATCQAAEVEIRYCTCGESETRTGDGPLAHSYTEQIVSEEYLASANCGQKATYYFSCSCGANGTETFNYGEIIAHSYDAVVTNPTCTDAGYTTYTCSCGVFYIANGPAASGHNN